MSHIENKYTERYHSLQCLIEYIKKILAYTVVNTCSYMDSDCLACFSLAKKKCSVLVYPVIMYFFKSNPKKLCKPRCLKIFLPRNAACFSTALCIHAIISCMAHGQSMFVDQTSSFVGLNAQDPSILSAMSETAGFALKSLKDLPLSCQQGTCEAGFDIKGLTSSHRNTLEKMTLNILEQ